MTNTELQNLIVANLLLGLKNQSQFFLDLLSSQELTLQEAKEIDKEISDINRVLNELSGKTVNYTIQELEALRNQFNDKLIQLNETISNLELNTLKIEFDSLTPEQKEFLKGARGDKGANGESSYQIAVRYGFVGNELDYLASLKGKDGLDGKNGLDGKDGKDGLDGENISLENYLFQNGINGGLIGFIDYLSLELKNKGFSTGGDIVSVGENQIVPYATIPNTIFKKVANDSKTGVEQYLNVLNSQNPYIIRYVSILCALKIAKDFYSNYNQDKFDTNLYYSVPYIDNQIKAEFKSDYLVKTFGLRTLKSYFENSFRRRKVEFFDVYCQIFLNEIKSSLNDFAQYNSYVSENSFNGTTGQELYDYCVLANLEEFGSSFFIDYLSKYGFMPISLLDFDESSLTIDTFIDFLNNNVALGFDEFKNLQYNLLFYPYYQGDYTPLNEFNTKVFNEFTFINNKPFEKDIFYFKNEANLLLVESYYNQFITLKNTFDLELESFGGSVTNYIKSKFPSRFQDEQPPMVM